MRLPSLRDGDLPMLAEFIDKLRVYSRAPGIGVALYARGQYFAVSSGVASVDARAPLLPTSRFPIGCLTKLLTSSIAVILAATGDLMLDTSIVTYLCELRGHIGDQLTLRHLLSHTGGYRGEDLFDSHVVSTLEATDYLARFNDKTLLFDPGVVYNYTHSATALVALAMIRATALTMDQLIGTFLLAPLGLPLGSSAAVPDDTSLARAHIVDLRKRTYVSAPTLRWSTFWKDSLCGSPLRLRELLDVGVALLHAQPPFSPAVRRMLLTPFVLLPELYGGARREDLPTAYGLGCAEYDSRTYGASSTGVGDCCALRLHPDEDIAIAVGINACQPYLRDYIVNKLLNALSSTDQNSRGIRARPPSQSITIDDAVGVYEGNENGRLLATACDDGLEIRAIDGHAVSHPIRFMHDERRNLVPKDDLHYLSAGFFPAPVSRTPCFMIAHTVYKKIT